MLFCVSMCSRRLPEKAAGMRSVRRRVFVGVSVLHTRHTELFMDVFRFVAWLCSVLYPVVPHARLLAFVVVRSWLSLVFVVVVTEGGMVDDERERKRTPKNYSF